jgi:hypothetical protein
METLEKFKSRGNNFLLIFLDYIDHVKFQQMLSDTANFVKVNIFFFTLGTCRVNVVGDGRPCHSSGG